MIPNTQLQPIRATDDQALLNGLVDPTLPTVASPSQAAPPQAMPVTPSGGANTPLPTIRPTPDPNQLPMLKSYQPDPRRAAYEQSLENRLYAPPPPAPKGFLGKAGHVLSTIGNIAGDIFAPSTMTLIPGTDLNRVAQRNAGMRELTQLQTQDQTAQDNLSRRNLEEQQASLAGEQANLLPGKDASDEALQAAQAYRAIHPLVTSAFDLWHDQNPTGTAEQYQTFMEKPISQQQADALNGNWDPTAKKNGLPVGQFKAGMPATDANALSASLNNVISRGQGQQHITIEQQQLAEKVPMLSPNGKGGYTLTYVQPGQTITPGSMTPTQAGSVNAPTTTEKNTAMQGQLVHEQIPMILSEIDKDSAQMGPILGHWNDFMQGKVGLENPQFAELRANLMMTASAVALAHARGRLPENLREEFDKMINAPQQSPANLEAVLKAIDPWMVKMGEIGQVPGITSPSNSISTGPPASPDNNKSFSLSRAMGLPFNKGKSEDQVRNDLQSLGYTVIK